MSSESPAQGRTKTEQRAATRVALMEAGITAFAEKGHDGVNLAKDILEPVGISVGSFYHQFDNKTDLLLAIIELATTFAEARYNEALPEDGQGMTPAKVSALWEAYLNMVDVREELVMIQLRETHSPHSEIADAIQKLADLRRDALAARYRQIAKQGLIVDAEAMSEMIEAVAVGALIAYLRTPAADRPRRKAELTERLTSMTLHGITGFIHDPDQAPDDAPS